ncbi:hypothetical protein L3X37_02730 [Sabulilitoribacter arenilitoris]|uniref:Uncharacterized protein n=1 Tax=Wocania arenilitoris TaxID=2044858 RepID=A0AAE3ELQ9_9FLAO|nr:hypothetical protein [Wocania arenilitoris]MCF7567281.1 hypothetical protein [Wocania arenilitoris]
MTYNNLIIIKGGSYINIKKALQQWIDLYSENFSNNLQFELYKNGRGNHIIKADDRLDNNRFFYLVNYMDYPENINYNVDIKGYTKARELDKQLDNQELLIYIPKSDTEYDNVYAVTKDNRHFKIDFGGKIKEVTGDITFSSHNIEKLENPETLKASLHKRKKREEDSVDSIKKRFNIIFIIFIIVLFLNLIVPHLKVDVEVFQKTTLFTGMGVGLWFFMDYEMLRHNSFYLKSFLIALGFYYYGLFLEHHYSSYFSNMTAGNFLYPLTLLIVQYPTRRIYKLIFNREPEVDKHGKIADLIYTMILFFSFAILPFLIVDYLK